MELKKLKISHINKHNFLTFSKYDTRQEKEEKEITTLLLVAVKYEAILLFCVQMCIRDSIYVDCVIYVYVYFQRTTYWIHIVIWFIYMCSFYGCIYRASFIFIYWSFFTWMMLINKCLFYSVFMSLSLSILPHNRH